MKKITKEELMTYVDHSLLKPNLTYKEVIDGLNFAKDNKCVSVCINPCNLDKAYEILHGTGVNIGTVVGFPSGSSTTFSKVCEAKDYYARGATELDMVIDVSAMKSKDYDKVLNDIKAVVEATPAVVKVIFENYYLTKEEIVKACELCVKAGAHYVKTSTGFAAGGATVEDIKLMRASCPAHMKVKAAGGISTYADCVKMIEAGSDRVGISKTQKIITEIVD